MVGPEACAVTANKGMTAIDAAIRVLGKFIVSPVFNHCCSVIFQCHMAVAAARARQPCGPVNARNATLIAFNCRSQLTCQFSQATSDCSVLNIISKQENRCFTEFLKNVLLMRIKICPFFDLFTCFFRILVRAEMKQFDSFRTSIRLRFLGEAVYTQSKLSGFGPDNIDKNVRRPLHTRRKNS
ncbi:hypothetical protein LP419_20585 [Massilia sp. H-1]|nr:hypothetical protein LP419_20585 [Massilia sp. H-1]